MKRRHVSSLTIRRQLTKLGIRYLAVLTLLGLIALSISLPTLRNLFIDNYALAAPTQGPTITTISPANGSISGGTTVTINGSDFFKQKKVTQISNGFGYSCAITYDKAYCWGYNAYGQLGNNSTAQSNVPVAVDASGVLNGKTVTTISTGGYHTCAVADGKAYCWGYNTSGQLGNNSTTQSNVPVAVDTSGVLNGKVVTDISAGHGSTCAIADGQAYCWGNGSFGELGNSSTSGSSVPIAVTTSGALNGKTVTDITVSSRYACAVASGKAYCWGFNSTGQLGDNTVTQKTAPVAVDTAGVLNGKTVTQIATNSQATSTTSYRHTCAVADGAAYCWGYNNIYQLGDNTTTQRNTPVAVNATGVLSGKTVTQVAVNDTGGCAIAGGAAYCWGYSGHGEVGDGGTTTRRTPVAVSTAGVLNGKTVTDISGGLYSTSTTTYSFNCAVASENAYCWGDNNYGQLGDNSTTYRTSPVAVNESAWSSIQPQMTSVQFAGLPAASVTYISSTQISATTPAHTDSVVNVTVTNPDGQSATLTNGYTYGTPPPTISSISPNFGPISGGTNVTINGTGFSNENSFIKISNGSAHSCALTLDHKLYCWGMNEDGEIGDGTTIDRRVPTEITNSGALNGKTITDVVAGAYSTCAVADGKAYCWGWNGTGQLGDNSTTTRTTPVAVNTSGVLNGKTVTKISTSGSDYDGDFHTCAIADGAAYCWGYNYDGQLGNNSSTNSNVPVAVSTSGALAGKTVTAISIASYSSCAVADGAAYCWGYNSDGQLGDGSTTTRRTPVAVSTSGVLNGKTVTDISTNLNHTCAVADGAAYCWGWNGYGELGDGSTTRRTSPVAVSTSGVLSGKTVSNISSNTETTCAVADGAAYCWGANAAGQLGDGSTSTRTSPVAVNTSGVLSGKTIINIASGGGIFDNRYFTCATTKSEIFCWGNNTNGQLGNNSTSSSTTPVSSTTPLLSPIQPIVYFGLVPATNVTYVNSTQLTATTPAHAAGLVNVQAINSDGQIALKTSAYTFTNNPPGAPTGLATTPAQNAVILNWSAPASTGDSPITDYKVEYSSNGGSSWQTFSHSASNATTISVTGLSVGTTYSFRVSAINAGGTGSPSNVATGTPIFITLTSSGAVTINLTAQGVTTISSNSHLLTLNTNSPSGYRITLEMLGGSRNLTNGGSSITPSAGTLTSPMGLLVNTWGYRVDSSGGFGNGPTIQESNVTSSGFTWAGVPANGSPDTIKTSNLPAVNSQMAVWYALNANSSKPSGAYTTTLLYTAISN